MRITRIVIDHPDYACITIDWTLAPSDNQYITIGPTTVLFLPDCFNGTAPPGGENSYTTPDATNGPVEVHFKAGLCCVFGLTYLWLGVHFAVDGCPELDSDGSGFLFAIDDCDFDAMLGDYEIPIQVQIGGVDTVIGATHWSFEDGACE